MFDEGRGLLLWAQAFSAWENVKGLQRRPPLFCTSIFWIHMLGCADGDFCWRRGICVADSPPTGQIARLFAWMHHATKLVELLGAPLSSFVCVPASPPPPKETYRNYAYMLFELIVNS